MEPLLQVLKKLDIAKYWSTSLQYTQVFYNVVLEIQPSVTDI